MAHIVQSHTGSTCDCREEHAVEPIGYDQFCRGELRPLCFEDNAPVPFVNSRRLCDDRRRTGNLEPELNKGGINCLCDLVVDHTLLIVTQAQ